MNTSANKIIGISGLPRSGKDSLAELFMSVGFYGVSFGDIVREYAFERHKDKDDPISVKNMTETSNWLRSKRGPAAVLDIALERFEEASKNKSYSGVVLFSIRAPIEVDYILERGGEIIWVETSDQIRYKRAMEHLRKGEAEISFEDFLSQEALQYQPQPGIDKSIQMDMNYVRSKATIVFENEVSFEEFKKEAAELVARLTA
jgi:dephospho-CoA kinase